jgi:hypothetical protein
MTLLYGFVTGILFGVFMQQASVLRFEKQIGALRFMDMTIVKFMFTAIVVGSIGVHLLMDLGLARFSPRGLSLGAQIIGGALFGIGWGIIGYCPGTSIGALGEGRYHVIWPIAGMLIGGGIFAILYPFVQVYIQPIGSYGRLSVATLLGINHWFVIAAMAVGVFLLFRFFERRGL